MAAAHLSAATGMSAVGLTGRCVQGPSRPRGYRPAQMRREEIIAILARVLCAGLAPTPMIADTLACLLLVLGVAFGLSRPLLDRFRLEPAEDLVAGAALSLVAAWGIAWAVFASGCPLWGYWLLPALAAAGLACGWRGAAKPRAPSPGPWPPGKPFIDIFVMPARPPLANVLAAAFLRMTQADYAHFQVIMAALCSLAYLPVGLLAGRFGGRPAARVAAVVLMVNPLFLQNATYPWTKLPAAFLILAGLYFFLRVRDGGAPAGRPAVLCALLLGGAVVTHYSAGPYVCVLALAWIAAGWGRWDPGFLRMTAAAAAAGACVLAPWFAWSVAQYGWHATFLSNSSVTTLERWRGGH